MSLLNKTSYLICFGEGSLNDLHILLTEEATGQKVVQDTLNAPQPGHQQLSVLGQHVQAAGAFYPIHVDRRVLSSPLCCKHKTSHRHVRHHDQR